MEKILPYISSFYTTPEVERIVRELTLYVKTLPAPESFSFSPNWYKNSTLYVLYPDSIQLGDSSPLESTKKYLHRIKELGANAIHLLPFLESPMMDKGFDVSNYYKIREGLGGLHALQEIKKEANNLGLHVFMDLIFNHVSREHEWFIKAQQGEKYYRDFFIHTRETPQFLGKVYKNSSVYAEYLINGEKELVSVAFPEFAGELPHWVEGKDGYWYYHTYYPDQIDLDWKNPEVFIELSKVLLYWTSQGFNFRLDAIPFIGKPAYKHLNTHNAFTHHLTAVFHVLAHQINPQCTFILETYEHLDSQIEYFGTANVHQAHMLYSFHLTTSLWVSLIEENVQYIWKQLRENKHIPVHAQWINFLRNHDELSFAYLDKALIEKIHKKLLPFGKAFRDGYGIAGRTYSLLGSDERRFLMSYFLLASLPGNILLPYGDEYGVGNVAQSHLPLKEQSDPRNVSRGYIDQETIESVKGKSVFDHVKLMLASRQLLQDYFTTWPEEITTKKGVFSARYTIGTSELIVFINLTKSHQTISFDTALFEEVANMNSFTLTKHEVKLGPYGGVWLQK